MTIVPYRGSILKDSLDGTEQIEIASGTTLVKTTAQDIANLGGGGGGGLKIASKIANYQIIAADNNTQFDNAVASGAVTLTLPAWAAGLRYAFVVAAGQTFSVDAAGSDMISNGFDLSSAVSSALVGSRIEMFTSNLSGTWIVSTQTGSWSYA